MVEEAREKQLKSQRARSVNQVSMDPSPSRVYVAREIR